MGLPSGHFLGIGNPLLDMLVQVEDSSLHEKYAIKTDDAILADAEHMSLYDEVAANPFVRYLGGGATLNSIKMIQWLSQEPGTCSYFGCIGKDDAGRLLQTNCDQLHLKANFITDDSLPTGKCAVIVKGQERSMVTHLGASIGFKWEGFTDEMHKLLNRAVCYYIAGYFVNSSMPTILKVAEHAAGEVKKRFCFNMSAPFLHMFFRDKIDQILPYVDILFGNKTEFMAFAKSHDLPETVDAVFKYLGDLQRPPNCLVKKRIIVITDGCDKISVQSGAERFEFKVPTLPNETIIDTNGAGDALVAGFLLAYEQNRSVSECITEGIKAAHYILKQNGFTLGNISEY